MRITSLGIYNNDAYEPKKRETSSVQKKHNFEEQRMYQHPKFGWVTLQKVNRGSHITILKICTDKKEAVLPSVANSAVFLSNK